MQNEKERMQSGDTVQHDVIIATRVPSAQSDATTKHYTAGSNATVKDQPVQAGYWEDEDDESHSYLMRLLTEPVPFWMAWLPLTVFIVHMVTWHGWPWNPTTPCVAQSMQLTQTADKTCIEFKGVSTICWDQPSKEGDAVNPGPWEIDPASGQITITEQHVL